MARKLYYKIPESDAAGISDDQWLEINRIQHWYNSEFVWTAGKLALKMYLVFVNPEHRQLNHAGLERTIRKLRDEYRKLGFSENEIIRQLEKDQLVIVKRGGYFDGCAASGFTRVAGNEFNAFLVCDFLLKVSCVVPELSITIADEGAFVKTKNVRIQNGEVFITPAEKTRMSYYENMITHRHVFSVVDAAKYDAYPQYSTVVPDFNDMDPEQRTNILHEWNWLGFESNYDVNGDDIQGFDLNEKVRSFAIEGV
ncbi:MAG TPA: hypothetical protein VL633_13800 [Bacteroidota bacterium]|jgi:hypothetical protein|nr:hypothetical protein [Bacteroidota bacterium]